MEGIVTSLKLKIEGENDSKTVYWIKWYRAVFNLNVNCLGPQPSMYNRVAWKTAISVKNSMTEGKRKLEWRRVRKYIRFLILFIPRSSNCKKPFRGFAEILIHKTTYEFRSFSIFYPTKKFAKKKYYKFQWHSLLPALIKKICVCAQRIFGFGRWNQK